MLMIKYILGAAWEIFNIFVIVNIFEHVHGDDLVIGNFFLFFS